MQHLTHLPSLHPSNHATPIPGTPIHHNGSHSPCSPCYSHCWLVLILLKHLINFTMQHCQLQTISGQSNDCLSTPASVLRQWNNHLSNPTLHRCLTKHHIELGHMLPPSTAYQTTIK